MRVSKVFLFIIVSINYTFSQSSFTFYGEDILPGTKKHIKVPISDGEHAAFIPVTVFCGLENGPILGVTAGVHGYEYPPILAGQKLIKSIDPKSLKGVVILVQIANVDSFSKRSPFVNPLDGKNLNRSFPGSLDGTVTERIASFITNNVIAKSDYFLDMHAGDASEDLMPYSAYYSNNSMPKVSETGKEMAQSLLFNNVIVFNTDGKDYIQKEKPSLYCSAEAFKRGIPAVDIECGGLGKSEKTLVKKIETGVLNLLCRLEMSTSTSEKEVQEKETYIYIENRTSLESKHDGIFYTTKKSGDYVNKGTKLGVITDYFGHILETVYAKSSGVILLIIGTPPVNKTETIVVIGDVSK